MLMGKNIKEEHKEIREAKKAFTKTRKRIYNSQGLIEKQNEMYYGFRTPYNTPSKKALKILVERASTELSTYKTLKQQYRETYSVSERIKVNLGF